MMNNLFLLPIIFVFWLGFFHVQAQARKKNAFTECFGAIELERGKNISLSLKGGVGEIADLFYYVEQGVRVEENAIWFSWEASAAGEIQFTQHLFSGFSEVTVFKNTYCDAIASGRASIYAQFSLTEQNNYFLLEDCKEGEVVIFVVNQPFKAEQLVFSVSIEEEVIETTTVVKKIVDRREDIRQKFLLIEIRDGEDFQPIIAQLSVVGIKGNSALYQASDLLLPQDRPLSFDLKIDAPMYFPEDRSIKTSGKDMDTTTVLLRKVTLGEQIELQGIEFHAGTTKLLDNSQNRLLRLRDFMLFNPSIKLEIQGHVHKIGKDDLLNRRLSRRRANSIRKYLIQNGIDKKRLRAKGFGNTMMRYPEPNTPEEIQANRRVEVKIIEL
ncbi:MAG: OmpA family protein [Crocinitomicaceae bacterium]|nr:OmpA family protein [Crocinitomicaceae bacterium]